MLERFTFDSSPVVVSLPMQEKGLSLHSFWREGNVLLESAKAGRYSFLCQEISSRLEYDGTLVRFYDQATHSELAPPFVGSLLSFLDSWEKQVQKRAVCPETEDLPFIGGWMGAFSYDLAREYIDFASSEEKEEEVPRAVLFWVEGGIIQDHQTNQWIAFSYRKSADELTATCQELLAACTSELTSSGTVKTVTSPRYSLEKEAFMHAVERVHAYIQAGDTYQVNLSTRGTREVVATPLSLYRALRQINPSPYMGLFVTPAFSLISGSPELLYSVENRRLQSRPIAGTRPTDEDDLRNESLSHELMQNGKERAEHLMLVDLIRNDMGRVCTYGTVQVDEFMAREQYSHVQHIVSHVSGRLRDSAKFSDIFQSMFPGGTITGAPKVRTMQIIEELEPACRGFYTGAMGYLSVCGKQNWNILIRSIVLRDGQAHVQAGAGVVIDSLPEKEFFESLQKAKALWQAIERANHA